MTTMRGGSGLALVLWLVIVTVPGCATVSSARYVYQDGQFGVVAIPSNTPDGPQHYRDQAEALMARHFPEGYEIVRAEEVPAGSRTLTVGKTGTGELAPQVSPHVLALLRVGGSMTRSQADTVGLSECRIIYKKADPHSDVAPGGFAAEPSATPACYLDPNTLARKHDDKETVKVSHGDKDPVAAAAATGSSSH
jgi:hypothetical protein